MTTLAIVTPADQWNIIDDLTDRLDAYMGNQAAFTEGYSYQELMSDCRELIWGEALELDCSPVRFLRWWMTEVVGFDIPRTKAERTQMLNDWRRKKDPWANIPKLTGKQRNVLAITGCPFQIKDIRFVPAGKGYRRKKAWERTRDSWQLRIDGQFTGEALLTLAAGTERRDHQMMWLIQEPGRLPFDKILCLKWTPLGVKRDGTAMKRMDLVPYQGTWEDAGKRWAKYLDYRPRPVIGSEA